MSTNPIVHSTGRGGAGNIGEDSHVYTDGGLVHEGVTGDLAKGGRGGAGNIGRSPRLGPQVTAEEGRRSGDFVPEINQREAQDDFHTGRGGAGNTHKEKYGGHSHSPERTSIGDKVKQALHLDKKDKSSPLAHSETTN